MNWIETRAGLQMAEIIIKYLPRITVRLENMNTESTKHAEVEYLHNDPDDGSWKGR